MLAPPPATLTAGQIVQTDHGPGEVTWVQPVPIYRPGEGYLDRSIRVQVGSFGLALTETQVRPRI